MTIAPPEGRKRRRFSLSVRSLMLLVLVAGSGMGWRAWWADRASTQRRAVALIRQWGGSVIYDYQWKDGELLSRWKPPTPGWAAGYLGPEYFQEVVRVDWLHQSPNAIFIPMHPVQY